MNNTAKIVVGLLVGLLAGVPLGSRLMPQQQAQATAAAAPAATQLFGAVPAAIGAEDIADPYDVVEGWPKDLASLPGHDKWTWGGARGVFAESPNRVYLLQGAELPNIKRPPTRLLPEIGPNVQFPSGVFRGATRTAAQRAYEFALIVEPLKLVGATGSTVAPIAVR